MQTPAEALGPAGALARHLPGFAPRPAQQEMADAVAYALENRDILICEAGTGTGKTFAYLVPALLSGLKIIVSTGTRNLQDQLFHRDLPLVRRALSVSARLALLKGRANYLCLHRLDTALEGGRLPSREAVADLARVRSWAGRTRRGDIAELGVAEDSAVWPLVTSSADNCLGQDCPRLGDCFLVKARRAAQEADVLVVNHHLLFADMALRDVGFGEILPGAQGMILDEAHQLPEVASSFFGISLSARALLELARDSIAEQLREAGDMAHIGEAAGRLEKGIADLRLALGEEARRAPWSQVSATVGVRAALEDLAAALAGLLESLEGAKARGKGLESCHRRCAELRERLTLVTGEAPPEHIHWFETFARTFAIHLTPLEVGETFRARMAERDCGWVLTSATLAVGDSFAHFAGRLGLADAHTRRWESPFDFRRQAVLFVPPDLPDPRAPGYGGALAELALEVLQASRGRAFLLFTSHRALQDAAQRLEGRLDFPLLIQGRAPRDALLARFRRLGNGVLLGTSSFWEGVDVRGEALSCVLIDRLPFASPGDPVLQARLNALRARGQDPFRDYQLPQAVITLKQGVGRLIRDVTDRGVMVLCDPRLLSKSYGRTFLDSLPPMTRTRRIEVVQRFFAASGAGAQ